MLHQTHLQGSLGYLYASQWARASRFILAIACLVPLKLAFAQRSDSFEGGLPRWLLVESDCSAQLVGQQIGSIAPQAGRTSELIDISCRSGSTALLAYPIEKTLILKEFSPRLWIRSSSGGIRLGVRVVYPASRHPVTGGKLTSILWGTAYESPGEWQPLRVGRMESLLREDNVALRQRFGGDIDLDAAYIDALVLNAYTSPGRLRLQVDSLSLEGMVPLSATGVATASDWRRRWRWRERLPTKEERFWGVDKSYGIWLHHNGESLPWLKSIGINGVALSKLPTPDELEDAAQVGMLVLSPPPEQPVEYADSDFSTIKGWLVGTALGSSSFEHVKQRSFSIHKLGDSFRKPIVAEALEQHWRFARVCDEVFVPQVARISAGTYVQKESWMESRLEALRPRTGGWATVSADVGSSLQSQYDAVKKAIFPNEPPERLASPLTTFIQAVSAVNAGARGILFRTTEPLVDGDEAQHANVAAVRMSNKQLQLWAPWIAHGQKIEKPEIQRSDFTGSMWAVADSRLVVACVATENSLLCVPPTHDRALSISVGRLPNNSSVYRITGGRMQRMSASSGGEKLTWRVDAPAPVEAFVISDNPLVTRYLSKNSRESLASNAADWITIAAYNLEIASRVVDSRFAGGPNEQVNLAAASEYLAMLAEAQGALADANGQMRRRNFAAALESAEKSSDLIQWVCEDSLSVACENLAAPQSSPFVLTAAALHMHWQLAEACERSTWRDLEIPGGDFQNLTAMIDAGWSQQRRDQDWADLRVELVPAQALQSTNSAGSFSRAGPSGAALRLASYRSSNAVGHEVEGGYEGATMLIESAPVEVAAGSLVRVTAGTKILRGSGSWNSGVLIYDNQAGPSMGQLINGNPEDFQQIELYRFIISDGPFRVFAECRGECDAVLTDLHISVIKPAQNAVIYPTTPVSIEPTLGPGENDLLPSSTAPGD